MCVIYVCVYVCVYIYTLILTYIHYIVYSLLKYTLESIYGVGKVSVRMDYSLDGVPMVCGEHSVASTTIQLDDYIGTSI
jgi:predicted MFS family arabinose efflux permease